METKQISNYHPLLEVHQKAVKCVVFDIDRKRDAVEHMITEFRCINCIISKVLKLNTQDRIKATLRNLYSRKSSSALNPVLGPEETFPLTINELHNWQVYSQSKLNLLTRLVSKHLTLFDTCNCNRIDYSDKSSCERGI